MFTQIHASSKSMYICLSYDMHKCDTFHSSHDTVQYYTNLSNVIKLLVSKMLFINCDTAPISITGKTAQPSLTHVHKILLSSVRCLQFLPTFHLSYSLTPFLFVGSILCLLTRSVYYIDIVIFPKCVSSCRLNCYASLLFEFH